MRRRGFQYFRRSTTKEGKGEERTSPHILRLTESSFIPVRPRPQREGEGLKLFKEEDLNFFVLLDLVGRPKSSVANVHMQWIFLSFFPPPASQVSPPSSPERRVFWNSGEAWAYIEKEEGERSSQ